MKLKGEITLKATPDGGRSKPIDTIYKPTFSIGNVVADCQVLLLGKKQLKPGERGEVEIVFRNSPGPLKKDMEFTLLEGQRTTATGTVKSVRK
jgi:translation elongation factor EF-Tu-like GTPase